MLAIFSKLQNFIHHFLPIARHFLSIDFIQHVKAAKWNKLLYHFRRRSKEIGGGFVKIDNQTASKK